MEWGVWRALGEEHVMGSPQQSTRAVSLGPQVSSIQRNRGRREGLARVPGALAGAGDSTGAVCWARFNGLCCPALTVCLQMWSPRSPLTRVPSPRDAEQRAGPAPATSRRLHPSLSQGSDGALTAHGAGQVLGDSSQQSVGLITKNCVHQALWKPLECASARAGALPRLGASSPGTQPCSHNWTARYPYSRPDFLSHLRDWTQIVLDPVRAGREGVPTV